MDFSTPRTGIHSYRILDVAIVDLLLTIGLGYGIAYYTGYRFLIVFIILMILSILVHTALGIKTRTNSLLL